MNLPPIIRVGFRDFTVVEVKEFNGINFGACDVNQSTIHVCTAFDPLRIANTLIHESMHAAWDSARLGAREAEENAVTHLADQLTQIWRDNPDFVNFVCWAVGEGKK
jgi:hypothetical protein